MIRVDRSVTILRPAQEVYDFWRRFENLPRFMIHLEDVASYSNGRSHWIAHAPAGQTVEWDAEIIEDIPGEKISWRSVDGSEIENAGSVRFRTAPGDRGTEVLVELSYDAPGGSAGAAVAKLFGEEPLNQLRDDMRRFKQVMETGEIMRSDGSPLGAGQGVAKQRAAQPIAPNEEIRP